MKMKLKRLLALGVALLVGVSALGMGASADWGDDPGQNTGDEVTLTKYIQWPVGLAPVDDVEFTFTVTPGTVMDGTTASPALVAGDVVTLTFGGKGTLVTSGDYCDTAGHYAVYTDAQVLDFGALTYPHAGVYEYAIKETACTTTTLAGTMAIDRSEYTLRVYVKNTADPALAVDKIEVIRTHDADGVLLDNGAATDPQPDPVKANLDFVNTYTQDADLEIRKTVTGAYGDLTKDFTYSVTLNAAPGVADGTTYTGYVVRQDGTTDTYTFTMSGGTATNTSITLAHGETLIFEDATDKGATALPVGTTYAVTETGAAGYVATVQVYSGTVSSAPALYGTAYAGAGETVVIGAVDSAGKTLFKDLATGADLTAPIAVVEGDNRAAWENEYKEVSPTGILMDNLPFILLIGVAIAGFAGYLALKRSRVNRQ